MQYHGPLFGHIRGTRKYFDTGKTSVDWDNMERENAALRDALQELRDEQNGAPLETRFEQWQAAMNKADALLANSVIRPYSVWHCQELKSA
jgi:hypothetical protein